MRYSNFAVLLLAFLLCLAVAYADTTTLTADGITATRGITNPANAYGIFNNITAYTTNVYSATGDTVTLNLSNYAQTGTVTRVNFSIRMNTSGPWNNDVIAIQYSNDSGTTWFTVQANLRPPAALTTYGAYDVTASFGTASVLNNAQVRLQYTRSGPQDNIRSGIDGVEMVVTYAPPPTVTLSAPADNSFVTVSTVQFNFTPSSLISFKNCSIYVNGTYNMSNQTLITSNAINSIDIPLDDGDYFWNATCYDTSLFAGTAAASRVVKVDTTSPNMTLFTPLNNTVSSTSFNRFNFSVMDAATVSSCSLVVDDVERNTYDNPSKGVELSTNATLTIGDHRWYINCTDAHGFRGQSDIFNLTIFVTIPTIVSQAAEYELGETVVHTGSNWQAGAVVNITTTMPNGTVVTDFVTANASGKINHSEYINYSYPAGTYLVAAVQANSSLFNASTQFLVNARVVSIAADLAAYIQGDTVTITGAGYAPNSTVNLTIKYPGGSNQTNISADSTGGFTYQYPLSLSAVTGTYNVSGRDRNFSNLYSNTSFIVNPRVTTVITDKTQYTANNTVNITGLQFSSLAQITLQIYNTITSRIGAGFPLSVTANTTGGFNYSWYTNHTCSGNYTVLAENQNIEQRANTTFLINNTYTDKIQYPTDGVSGNRVTPVLSSVNSSNDVLQNAGVTATNQWGYLQFAFHPKIPAAATSIVATVAVEQRRTANRAINYQMYYVNASGVYILSGCSGALSSTDTIAACNISNYTRPGSRARDFSIRVNYTTTQSVDAQVDFAYVNVSWVGDPYNCQEFGDVAVAPTISGIITPQTPVVLNAGSIISVDCNFTVYDGNGASEITGANVSVYTAPSTSSSGLSNVTKYHNTSCSVVNTDANSKDFTCTVDLLYYAQNGTWTCNATGISTDGRASITDVFEVDPLYAINITETLLGFGNLTTGEISANITQNVTNIGNQRINISAYGYGRTPGDNNAFTCPSQSIPIGNLHFASNSTANYTQKQALSGSPQQLRLPISPQVTYNVLRTNTTYWQVQIPPTFTDTGECNGTIIFQAELS